MPAASGLMTVEEFAALPEAVGGVRQELWAGEVIEMPPPKLRHTKIQQRIVPLLNFELDLTVQTVDKEFPFCPVGEHYVWIADVAAYTTVRASDETGAYFRGVPELVVEVLSPSNSAAEVYERQRVCLKNGAVEFWVVDPERKPLYVYRADGVTDLSAMAPRTAAELFAEPA
jgi:Uma2 family endonuclease